MMQRAHGLVIRHRAFGNTSQVVQCLTGKHGVVHLLAKGVWRPRNPKFEGGFNLGSLYEFLFIPRRTGLHIATEAMEENGFRALRRDRRRMADAFFILAFLRYYCVQNAGDEPLFRLVLGAMQDLDRGNAGALLAFLREALVHTGFFPMLEQCAVCGRPRGPAAMYQGDFQAGGLICSNHRANQFFRLTSGALECCLFDAETATREAERDALRFFMDWANYVLGFKNTMLKYPFYLVPGADQDRLSGRTLQKPVEKFRKPE